MTWYVSFIGIYPEDMTICSTHTCSAMLLAAVLIIFRQWKQPESSWKVLRQWEQPTN